MTAATITLDAPPTAAWTTRVWSVVKLHAANPWATLTLPLAITLGVFALHYVVWQTVVLAAGGVENVAEGGLQTTGGASWVGFYLMSTMIQAMNQTFRFALSLSATRRDYYAGTVLYFSLVSLGFTVLYIGAAAIERATDGWGVNAAFFAPGIFSDYGLWVVGLCWALFMLLLVAIGVLTGTVFVRWKSTGIVTMYGTLAVALVAAVWLLTKYGGWDAVDRFFADTSLAGVLAWSLTITVPLMVAGYALLRRAAARD